MSDKFLSREERLGLMNAVNGLTGVNEIRGCCRALSIHAEAADQRLAEQAARIAALESQVKDYESELERHSTDRVNQRRELAVAREALAIFARLADLYTDVSSLHHPRHLDAQIVMIIGDEKLRVADLRKARAALAKLEGK